MGSTRNETVEGYCCSSLSCNFICPQDTINEYVNPSLKRRFVCVRAHQLTTTRTKVSSVEPSLTT
jgi:hypothetical protein